LVITGSPKFDALLKAAATYDRATIRKRHGVPDTVTLLVGASRWTAIGTVFRDVVKAVEAEPDVWLLVKPHQAERPDRYEKVIEEESSERVRVVSVDENLISLIVASDGLLTVDSLASSEALVIGRPVFVVNLPNHNEALVERGVALGSRQGEEIAQQLKRFLHEPQVRAELDERRKRYIHEFAYGADGLSTERILAALRECADKS
jgi:UDP-N-acetylglucosamine:LPS N-acetylglucosamine transferase